MTLTLTCITGTSVVILDSDYDNYAVVFVCIEPQGKKCGDQMVLFYSRKDVRQTLMAYFNSYTIQNSSIASLYCRFKYRLIKQEREHCTFHFFYFNNNFLQVLKRKYIKHGETY